MLSLNNSMLCFDSCASIILCFQIWATIQPSLLQVLSFFFHHFCRFFTVPQKSQSQTSFPKHKPISRKTQINGLGSCSVIIRGLIPRIFCFQHGDFYNAAAFVEMFCHNCGSEGIFVLLPMWNKVRHCCTIFSITVVL